MLSNKQKEALSRGREERWLQRELEKANNDAPDHPPVLKRESKSQYVDDNNDEEDSSPSDGYVTRPEPADYESSSEEDEEFKKKLRARALKRSIPRALRKNVEVYLEQKLEESKQNMYVTPPSLTPSTQVKKHLPFYM